MTTFRPDPTFYPSPSMAMEAPPERYGYVATFWRDEGEPQKDAVAAVDLDPNSPTYSQVVGWCEMPNVGDELHHHGWNACSSALCPSNPHPHVERRHLLFMGLRSSRIHFVDVKKDPKNPSIAKIIEPQEYKAKSGYSRPHTAHCGPEGIYVTNLGAADGDEGPGGIALLDHDTYEVIGTWEKDRGDQYLAYDFWWHINHDVMITSEWGTPRQIENGIIPEELLANKYGHKLHFFDMKKRRNIQTIDLGEQYQMTLELRPAHDPAKEYGFVGIVISTEDLSGSIWCWYRDGEEFAIKKVFDIPAEPCDDVDLLPNLLKGFGAVPALITDIDLTVDDKYLFVSCFGQGRSIMLDVSDPLNVTQVGEIRVGGIATRAPHPSRPDVPLLGAPQMVEISRDGKRVYWTNSLYGAWDDQFYPDGVGAWMVKANIADGTMTLDPDFFVGQGQFRGNRVHQVHLEGGDASSDSYCFS
ncbi:selenium-binding protein 1 [Kineosphaera limosa]|uniref:Putative selenium-binding protein n=1 Tax=Kineosphaera limosa NBRC 100340 TaxID=1184609 RepID=K6X5W2_9MICO|nr:selenium-binding protein SBP56-related protein [Kineosphaera limosa]NYE02334.1 selenium-binding protein 1 [Kineosphaera limosa]GAB94189.1 putative selenium-binding protein [Kineosphaera limosa NBRC 100340]